MQARLIELHLQRGRLLERIAMQRQTLALQVQPLKAPLALPARLLARLQEGRQFILENPYLVGSAVVALVVLRPGFVWRWAERGVMVWRTLRTVRALVPPGMWDMLRQQIFARRRYPVSQAALREAAGLQ